MSLRDQILESMARTVFVVAYANACEEYDAVPHWEELPEHLERFGDEYDAPRAGPGEDWMGVAPDATEFDPQAAIDARALAVRMLAEFLKVNGSGLIPNGERADRLLQTLLDEWCSPESQKYGGGHNAETFGHYIVMQSLGTGVGLNDDTGPGCREWKCGRFEGISL